jgi:hypothetical protein
MGEMFGGSFRGSMAVLTSCLDDDAVPSRIHPGTYHHVAAKYQS